MTLDKLSSEIKQGLRNEYIVQVDTLGGFSYKITELLNDENDILVAKIEKGMIYLEPSTVVSVIKIESSNPRVRTL
ncbi:hypothetical protein [Staphylococcus arlettae]|uniref:hypothetical protein n=1 Tax=Staphylococcus arlettae TaxID=29378 RepID=UPI000D1BC5F2|nr:hypothetical protein [Staphylococcus arlettae]PUZ30843.1 hypothetical protein BU606_13140 [Staphylococcus arlettae]